jgi:hypothetical protein
VLEVGAGVGHLSQFFVQRGCRVTATEARAQNVAELRRLYPNLNAHVVDVEDDLAPLGRHEVVFCYGLLYHLENPIRALRNMAAVCEELLLIETMVTDSEIPVLRLDDEYKSATQALFGLAHRPSPAYLALALDRIGFHHVYIPKCPPQHPDYGFDSTGDLSVQRDGHLLRGVFVASRKTIESDRLIPIVEESDD